MTAAVTISNGTKLAYYQEGSGPDLVFLHGLASNRSFWYMRVARALQDRYRSTLYDLRGHGSSDLPHSGYTPAEMAEDLHGLLEALEVENPVLVGHSFGGVVALQYAVKYPERVRALAIADSRINTLQPTQRLKDSPHLSRFEEAFLEESRSDVDWDGEDHLGIRFLEEVAKARYMDLRIRMRSDFVPFGGRHGSKREAMRWLKLLKETSARRDFRVAVDVDLESLHSIDKEVLLVYGDRSRCLPSGRALEKHLKRCKTVIVPDAGHFHPATRPGFFLKALEAFLASLDDAEEGGREPVEGPANRSAAFRRRAQALRKRASRG